MKLFDAEDVRRAIEDEHLVTLCRMAMATSGNPLLVRRASDLECARVAAAMVWLDRELAVAGCSEWLRDRVSCALRLRAAQTGPYRAAAYLHALYVADDPKAYRDALEEKMRDQARGDTVD